jgi:hypothetical protein
LLIDHFLLLSGGGVTGRQASSFNKVRLREQLTARLKKCRRKVGVEMGNDQRKMASGRINP